jgi:carboxypeptidase Taq
VVFTEKSTIMKHYGKLVDTFRQLAQLEHVAAVCHWDEAVMMPTGGGKARSEAMGLLQSVRHTFLIDPKIGDWIALAEEESLPPWEKANLKWMKRAHLQACCLPTDLVQKSEQAFIRTEQAWRTLRAENNWRKFAPLLNENLQLIKERAAIKAQTFSVDPYDALIDEFSPGLSQAIINPIFETLQHFLPNFIVDVMDRQKKLIPIEGLFPSTQQKLLCQALMRMIGFNFDHGRLDESHHPFCGGVPSDVRITTRYNEKEFITAAMGVCHETGHGLYEQNLPADWTDQPVGQALGMALHESQSLLMEMQVCRSREFMVLFSQLVMQYFGEKPAFSAGNLYHHYIHVQPDYIRVDADEVCYPLHIILRYELEKKLIKGEITVEDLPELWNMGMQQWLGLSTENNYRQGVMQDVHWSAGLMGYFPAYTIGAIIAAQLFQSFKNQYPRFGEELITGNFSALTQWLAQQVHSQGRFLDMNPLLIQATGRPLTVEPFINHLKQRYLNHTNGE